MLKKISKILLKLILWLIACLAVISAVIYFTAGLWIKPVVGFVVPKITQTKVSLADADISLFSGRLGIKGLKIGNPDGFKEPDIFELAEFSVQFKPRSVFTNKIIIDQVLIKGTQIVAEYNQLGQLNLMVLNDNVQSLLNKDAPKQQVAQVQTSSDKSKKSSGKDVVIKDLQILDSKMSFAMMGRSMTLNLPNIQEKNIGEKKKMTFSQSIQLLIDKLTLEPINEMAKSAHNALQNAFKTIEEHTKNSQIINKLKNSFNEFALF